jgi:hypothetical protein
VLSSIHGLLGASASCAANRHGAVDVGSMDDYAVGALLDVDFPFSRFFNAGSDV